MSVEPRLFEDIPQYQSPRGRLLKWIGSKHATALKIVAHFPASFGTYHEPFLGSGAILATLAPAKGVGSDLFVPLMQIWMTLSRSPERLMEWYAERWHRMESGGKQAVYEQIRSSYNADPNGADLLFLCRSCYGGVVRFRKADGYMSTPCGVHAPIRPEAFARRVSEWHRRVRNTEFRCAGFEAAMGRAQPGDLVYCDPPYAHSQSILYGAQGFCFERLLEAIEDCKRRHVFVALSIDGHKKSGKHICDLPIPPGLFEREILIDCGRSMLRRFQMRGQSLHEEIVSDRLLLTY